MKKLLTMFLILNAGFATAKDVTILSTGGSIIDDTINSFCYEKHGASSLNQYSECKNTQSMWYFIQQGMALEMHETIGISKTTEISELCYKRGDYLAQASCYQKESRRVKNANK